MPSKRPDIRDRRTHRPTPDGLALTDPTVPRARPIMAYRITRTGTVKHIPAAIPLELSAWLDLRHQRIHYATPEMDITDWASKPWGGKTGVQRIAGRLHDLMATDTPILVLPEDPAFAGPTRDRRIYETTRLAINRTATLANLTALGWTHSEIDLSVWQAGAIYYRILVSVGYPAWQARLQRIGLRGLGLQHLYRAKWATDLRYAYDLAATHTHLYQPRP